MKLTDFDYYFPKSLIAQFPKKIRSRSRLLVLNKENDKINHSFFYNLPLYLKKGDVIVMNNSKVFPARLIGNKESGGGVEIFLINEIKPGIWELIGKNLKIGQKIKFDNSTLMASVIEKVDNIYTIEFNLSGENFFKELEKIGQTPLPPYIKRDQVSGQVESIDKDYYQTVYAKERGSVAAPTAGLHFTNNLLKKLKAKGVIISQLTLHVGLGTFAPVKVNNIVNHKMHKEFFSISKKEYEKIIQAKKDGRRIIAIGTTTTRVLEHLFKSINDSEADRLTNQLINQSTDFSGWTDIFIYPGYKFKCIDGLITNFHLPKSTLLMLVCAFAGKKKIFDAYNEAISKKYKFYSYGDAMLII